MPPCMKLWVPSQDRLGTDSIDVHAKVVINQPDGSGGNETGPSKTNDTGDGGVGSDSATSSMEAAEEVEAPEDHTDVVCLEAERLKRP